MDDRKRNIAVGLTGMAGLAGIILLLTLFGNIAQSLFDDAYTLQVDFPNAGGLNEGSRVMLSGVDIGHVSGVSLRQDNGSGVRVTISVREDVRVPRAASPRIESKLLGGSPDLAFVLPDADRVDDAADDATGFFAVDGQEPPIRGEASSLAGQFAEEMKRALEGPTSELEAFALEFKELSDAWTEVGNNVNQLVRPASPEDVDADTVAANLATVLQRADGTIRDLQQAIDQLQAWTGDEQLREDVKTAAANVRDVSGSIRESVDEFRGVATGAQENLDQLTRRYLAVADDLSGVVTNMQKVTDQAADGEGTFGKLLNDPRLYDNLTDTADRLNATLDELRLLIEKWKAEGVPIQL